MARVWTYIIILMVVADIATSLFNTTVDEEKENNSNLTEVRTRRAKKEKHRSTSSSSGDKERNKGDESAESKTGADSSLDMTTSFESSKSSSKSKREINKYVPKSTEERKGWRKWHRKCTPCPNDVRKKWRDPSINWICGGYQRARRSFKSPCMMRYRNCQDGTMFVRIKDHRCENDTGRELRPHGEHWFYDYKVSWSLDSEETVTSKESSSSSGHSRSDAIWSSSREWRRANVRHKKSVNITK